MILVTGATGHIGNVLVRQLCGTNAEVRGLIQVEENIDALDGLDVELVEGDVLDYPSLLTAFDGVDFVYHLAGMITIMPEKNPLVTLVNLQGTRNIIQAAKDSHVQRLIYVSSIHAMKRVPHGVIIDENVPFDPIDNIGIYDHSKALASVEILKSAREGLDAVIACPTGVIGPFDFRGSEIGKVVSDCLDMKPQVYFDGAYDFVDVRDVARGLRLMSEQAKNGETYILSGKQVKVVELIDTIQQVLGKKLVKIKVSISVVKLLARFTPLYYRILKVRPRITPYSIDTLLSNSKICRSKAENDLGYNARPLTESIADSIAWFINYRGGLGTDLALPSSN